jgi:CDP-glucose 4,6-dehydratase
MKDTFNNKKVLVTGHTGFKGTWLTLCLLRLGAKVIGLSFEKNSNSTLYQATELNNLADTRYCDIRDKEEVKNIILTEKPDFIFHLAAQALTLKSYEIPHETFETNFIGSLNVLEALRVSNHNCTCIMVTSDKSYKNDEWIWGYREIDKIGGDDPYSASKGTCELLINSYYQSFFSHPSSNTRVATARAGNVIGGGDFSENRLIPDCVKAWKKNESVIIRNELSTRPWQHVLDPTCGYILLAAKLSDNKELNGEAFNFGPPANQMFSVKDVITKLAEKWTLALPKQLYKLENTEYKREAHRLKLNCDKAKELLNWQAELNIDHTLKYTADWYINSITGAQKARDFTFSQIDNYLAQVAYEF